MSDLQPVARRGAVRVSGYASPLVFRFMARCYGFHKWLDNGEALFEASRKNIALWDELFPDAPIHDADGTIGKLVLSVVPIVPHARKSAPTVAPFKHQDRALSIAMSRETYGFFYDMGTGKSQIIITAIVEQYFAGLINRAIVFTKKRGVVQFLEEQIPLHMPHGFKNYEAQRFPSTQSRKAFRPSRSDLLIAVTGYGSLQSKQQTEALIEFAKSGACAVHLDECQEIKGWASLRVTNLWKLRPHALRRYLYSGEPAPLGYVDLYSQFMFMDPNILGHGSLTSFKKEYCVFGGYKTKEIVEYKDIEKLSASIAPHCEFLKITDCMDMPERSWETARFEPTDEQRKIYRRLKDEFVIAVERTTSESDVEVKRRVVKEAGAKFIALQQVANGWFATDPNDTDGLREIIVINDERAKFVVEELVSLQHKTIIWARFHADLASLGRVLEESKIPYVEISGRISSAQCESNRKSFQEDPRVKVLIGTAASGGTSLNLQCSSNMIYFSNSFSFGDRAQSERRIWRAGQLNHCRYIDVHGFPIDRLTLQNLHKKQDLSSALVTVTGLAQLADQL